MGVLDVFASLGKLVASDTLQPFATALATLHRLASFDWPARFALRADEPAPPPVSRPTPRPPPSGGGRLPTSKLAQRLGVANSKQLLAKPVEEGLLVASGDSHALTERGRAEGDGLLHLRVR